MLLKFCFKVMSVVLLASTLPVSVVAEPHNKQKLIVSWLQANLSQAVWVLNEKRIEELVNYARLQPFVNYSMVVKAQEELDISQWPLRQDEVPLAVSIYHNDFYIGDLVVSFDASQSANLGFASDYETLDYLANLLAISMSGSCWNFDVHNTVYMMDWLIDQKLPSIEVESVAVIDPDGNLLVGMSYLGQQKAVLTHTRELGSTYELTKALFYHGRPVGWMQIGYKLVE